jgi:hypothetical protein
LQLFISSGHDYNAGPLFRWAANAIKDIDRLHNSELYSFFWIDGRLNEEAQHLSDLRNRVMHGFFVLPPETNRAEAERMGRLLESMTTAGLFESRGEFHFFSNGAFTGHWNISDVDDWEKLKSHSPFGILCRRVVEESGAGFWAEQAALISDGDEAACPSAVKDFIGSNSKGAMALWLHPVDDQHDEVFRGIGKWLSAQNDVVTIAYSLSDSGLSFSSEFLLRRLQEVLQKNDQATSTSSAGKGKKPEDLVAGLRKQEKRKVVVLINRVHLALFSRQHLTTLTDFFHRNNIMFICTGHHYRQFDTFFNRTETIAFGSAVPDAAARKSVLRNYLRFKGPFADRPEDAPAYAELEQILNKICDELQAGQEVYARRFADAHGYPAECVHEIFEVLHPWVKSRREAFEADTLDELYGFPSVITEVTPVYLALGRRDLKLEYQHKVLSL